MDGAPLMGNLGPHRRSSLTLMAAVVKWENFERENLRKDNSKGKRREIKVEGRTKFSHGRTFKNVGSKVALLLIGKDER